MLNNYIISCLTKGSKSFVDLEIMLIMSVLLLNANNICLFVRVLVNALKIIERIALSKISKILPMD